MDPLQRITVDPRLDLPLAQQLREQITWLIASGVLQAGDWLPPVRALARHLGINMHTVRSAYLRLEADGLVQTRQGQGTRVLPYDLSALTRLATATRSNTIGVVVPGLINPLYHAMLNGIQQVAERDHTLLFVCDLQEDVVFAAPRYLAQLLSKQVDGIIASSFDAPALLSAQTGRNAFPLVTIDWPDATQCSVVMNLENAGYVATRHLLEHGHTRIGLITFAFPIAHVDRVNAGHARALHEAGLDVPPELTARVYGFGVAEGATGTRMLLNQPQPPTAIFAITDLMALGALQTVRSAGLRVPEDIALVGFNDIPLATLVDPPLTTVHAPAHELGVTAMALLQRLIAGEAPPDRPIVLPTTLIVRQSCGPHAG